MTAGGARHAGSKQAAERAAKFGSPLEVAGDEDVNAHAAAPQRNGDAEAPVDDAAGGGHVAHGGAAGGGEAQDQVNDVVLRFLGIELVEEDEEESGEEGSGSEGDRSEGDGEQLHFASPLGGAPGPVRICFWLRVACSRQSWRWQHLCFRALLDSRLAARA